MLREAEAHIEGKLFVCLCIMIIPIAISLYMGKNNITCRRKEKANNSMKLGFPSAALLFLHLVGLSEGVLPRYIAAIQDGGQSCILWSLCNISTSKSSRTASVIIFVTVVVAAALLNCCCYCCKLGSGRSVA